MERFERASVEPRLKQLCPCSKGALEATGIQVSGQSGAVRTSGCEGLSHTLTLPRVADYFRCVALFARALEDFHAKVLQ